MLMVLALLELAFHPRQDSILLCHVGRHLEAVIADVLAVRHRHE